MRTFILRGNSKKEFIDKFITDKNIPPFNVFEYKENIGIAEAKDIKKIASVGSLSESPRVFIIESKLTIEAQNALLKLIEELPQDSYFIFMEEEALLPTIISRCQIIVLSNDNKAQNNLPNDDDLKVFEENFFNVRQPQDFLIILDNFFVTKKEHPIDELIILLHKVMLRLILRKELKKIEFTSRILKSLIKENSFIKLNNLNPRIMAETIFLQAT